MQAENRKPAQSNGAGVSGNGQPDDNYERRSGGHEEHIPVDLPPVSRSAVVVIVIVLVVLFGGLFALGWFPHTAKLNEARAEAAEAASDKPVVDATKLQRSPAKFELTLPGNVDAYQTTAVFARTSGYLDPLPPGIDIGAEVQKGDVIATITAPEVDADLAQAKATVEQAVVTMGRAKNEYEYNKGTYDRYTGLKQTGGVTEQQIAEKRAALNIAESSLKASVATKAAADAALQRLQALKGFQTVTAPFDGVITSRNYDSGALISATPGGSGRELFRLTEVDRLRVFIDVPQSYATEVRPGQEAYLKVRNYPGRVFKGIVARTAGAIDQNTRTMRVEVDVDNRRPDEKWDLAIGTAGRALLRPIFQAAFKRDLYPGMFTQVTFEIARGEPPLMIPTSALIFGADGSRVAIVDSQNKVHFKTVVIGRDYGSEAEIASGLNGDERVVKNPGERLVEGIEVEVHKAKNPPATKEAKPHEK
jgi:RND family efflux transporter MFP subunit